jgi:hypothetical protein
MNNLIICNKCLLDGKRNVLGVILNGGTVQIERKRSLFSFEESTLISGNDFTLTCGYCKTPVFVRKEENAKGGSQWEFRISRISFGPGTVVQELSSCKNNPGTPIFTSGS